MALPDGRKSKIILATALVLSASLICIGALWWIGWGTDVKVENTYSYCSLAVFSNSEEMNMELLVPIIIIESPDSDWPDYSNSTIVDTLHGKAIRLIIHLGPENNYSFMDSWTSLESIMANDFSTQEGNAVWIQCNGAGNAKFCMFKADEYSTMRPLTGIIEYQGVMLEKFPDEVDAADGISGFIRGNSVDLEPGWNSYELIEGQYLQTRNIVTTP